MCRKLVYVRRYLNQNHVYTRLWGKNSRTGRKRDKNEGKQISWDKIHSHQKLPRKHAPIPNSEIEKSEQLKNIECRKNPQIKMTRNSAAESPILLRREIPMNWGTTIDRLTLEINPSLYARETKHLTLKDQTSYLIPDSWSRSPLSFPTLAWIDEHFLNNK